jgi:hypothetical protein
MHFKNAAAAKTANDMPRLSQAQLESCSWNFFSAASLLLIYGNVEL